MPIMASEEGSGVAATLVLIAMFVFAPSDPALPGAGNVKIAGAIVASRIVPPFKLSALVDA